jgi:hypothetical protein
MRTYLDDTSGHAPVALTNVEIPSNGRVLKSQDEAAPTRNQRRAGHLPGGFQKRANLESQGIGYELHGVDPVIHGPEHHSVPREGLDTGRHRVLFGSSSPQSDLMKLGTGG